MRTLILTTLFLFGTTSYSKTDPEKVLNCTEKGCGCQGSKCSFVDPRVTLEASTVVVTCADKNCGQKIVFELKDKYGCKGSAQKLRDLDFIINSECLIIQKDGPVKCAQSSEAESIQNLVEVCVTKANP